MRRQTLQCKGAFRVAMVARICGPEDAESIFHTLNAVCRDHRGHTAAQGHEFTGNKSFVTSEQPSRWLRSLLPLLESIMKLSLAVLAALSMPVQAATPDFIFHNGFEDPASCVVAGLTRINLSDITYGPYSHPVRYAVPVTEYNNIWGHNTATDGTTPWPGISGSGPVLQDFTRRNFLAAHFRTGADTTRTGTLYTTYAATLDIDLAISTQCGDFTYVPPGCLRRDVSRNGGLLASFTFATNNVTKCALQPNTDYWLNMKYSDPNSTTGCAAGAEYCPLASVLQLN
jgi:hypothetical protein